MDRYMPDSKVAGLQEKLLQAKKVQCLTFPATTTEKEIRKVIKAIGGEFVSETLTTKGKKVYFSIPDYDVVDKAVDKVYKLKGKYAAQKIQVEERPLEDLSDEELDELLNKKTKELSKE